MKNHAFFSFIGLANSDVFFRSLQNAISSLEYQTGIFAGDGLFTYNRNLSFLDDEKLMAAHAPHAQDAQVNALIWRIAVVLWGARQGLRLQGDFVECACYRGITAKVICDTIEFHQHPERQYYLYDLFEHHKTMAHHAMPAHSRKLFREVKSLFAEVPNVTVTQGKVPDILETVAPEKIAFMHLDLNNAEAEIGALEVLFERMVPGAILVLDDYGWLTYREQRLAEERWFGERGYHVLEIPTGQGIVIK
jgi:hypothetical protein